MPDQDDAPYQVLSSSNPTAQVKLNITEPQDLRFLLRKQGLEIRDLAERLDVHSSTVSTVVSGRGTSERVEQAVADVTGLRLEQVQRVTRAPREKKGWPGA